MKDTVTVLILEHKHGSDAYVFRAEADAKRKLIGFVRDWWDADGPDTDIPDDDDAAIAEYFKVSGESYTIQGAEIQ